MAQPQIFPAGPEAKRTVTRYAYRYAIGGAGLLLIGVIALAVSAASQAEPPPMYLTAIFTTIACLGGAGLILAVTTLFKVRQRVQVEVTDHRLIWREGPKVATLEFDEVERVDLVKDVERRPSGTLVEFPVIRFIENDGEMMEFEISFDDKGVVRHGRFDAHAITEVVLPHVRNQAVISPAVDEFVKTGFVDIDGLPKR